MKTQDPEANTGSGDLLTAKISGYESFDFGFDAAFAGTEEVPHTSNVPGKEDKQKSERAGIHTIIWQLPMPGTQQPIVEGLQSRPAQYTEYLYKSAPVSAKPADYMETPEPLTRSRPTARFVEYLFKSSPNPQQEAETTDLSDQAPKPTPSPRYKEYLYSSYAPARSLPQTSNTVGITITVTPPPILQRLYNSTPLTDAIPDFNFLQLPGQHPNTLRYPGFVEVPQRIVDPGTPEGAAELGLPFEPEESSSWSDWDSDESTSSGEPEESGIDWAEARPATPEELNHVEQFLSQQLEYAGYTHETEQASLSSPSTSRLPISSPSIIRDVADLEADDLDDIYSSYFSSPALTPAQQIILEYKTIQVQHEADGLFKNQKDEVHVLRRQVISEPSPLRQVACAY